MEEKTPLEKYNETVQAEARKQNKHFRTEIEPASQRGYLIVHIWYGFYYIGFTVIESCWARRNDTPFDLNQMFYLISSTAAYGRALETVTENESN